ncbi:hypothetical protein ACHAQH_001629 [Verticillium albo-atrum]
MAPAAKTNFKTYEAQARLMRAIIAAHPEVKWNYKVISELFGSDMTEAALDHRFRALKAHADVVRQAREQKVDCKDVPADLPKDKKEIARMFGGSTADGIQFQFRAIKQDANTLKATVNSGGNPASALSLGTASTASTPRGPKATAAAAASTPTTASKRSASAVSRSGASSTKRTKLSAVKPAPAASSEGEDDDDDDDDFDKDYEALDNDTPKASFNERLMASGRKKQPTTVPAVAAQPASIFNNPSISPAPRGRVATANAAARISQLSVDLTTSDSEANTPPEMAPASQDAKFDMQGYGAGVAEGAFSLTGVDGFIGGSPEGGGFHVMDLESFPGSEPFDEI